MPAHDLDDAPLALVCERLSDDASGLTLRRWPLQPPGPADVLIDVRAAALNFPDLLMTRGGYQFKPPLPYVCGMEGSGIVLQAGPDSGWRAGDRVCFSHKHGAIAERTVVPGSAVAPLPDAVPFDIGAAAWVTGITAWVSLARIARLQRGDTLLVHGARGGVGQACVQLGLHLGARVIATATHPESIAALTDEGVIVLPADAFREGVLAATDGRGADVIADPVGGEVFAQSRRCIAYGGRLLVLGFASGEIPSLNVNHALIKGYSVVGVRAGEHGRRFPQQGAEHRAAVQRLIADGVIRPHIGAHFALRDAAMALQTLADRSVTGKIVVMIPPPTA